MRLFLLLLILGAALPSANGDELRLDVVLSERKLHVIRGETIVRSYPIAVGTIEYPTPEGAYEIRELIWNPPWVPLADREWTRDETRREPGDPENPMRVLKIPFDAPYYYIHGTPDRASVGTMASHGCIRMNESDVAELGIILMEHTGLQHARDWVRNVRRKQETEVVRLREPVGLRISMGKINIYPGVIWAIPESR